MRTQLPLCRKKAGLSFPADPNPAGGTSSAVGQRGVPVVSLHHRAEGEGLCREGEREPCGGAVGFLTESKERTAPLRASAGGASRGAQRGERGGREGPARGKVASWHARRGFDHRRPAITWWAAATRSQQLIGCHHPLPTSLRCCWTPGGPAGSGLAGGGAPAGRAAAGWWSSSSGQPARSEEEQHRRSTTTAELGLVFQPPPRKQPACCQRVPCACVR